MLLPAQPVVLTKGTDSNHMCPCVCRPQAPLPPAMCLEDMKEPASVNTWVGLASPGGRKNVSPAPILN